MAEKDYAQRAIDEFLQFGESQFREGYYAFACQAAFPVGFTPHLLYQLWANFHQCQLKGKLQMAEIPMIAISDLLLSPLCEKVSADIFEMDNLVRARLLEKLPEARKKEIAHFLYQYIEANLQNIRHSTFYQSLYWNALVTIAPRKAFLELSTQLSEAVHKNQEGEILRLRSLLEAFAQQDKGLDKIEASSFNKLLDYSKAIKASFLDYPEHIIDGQLKKSVGPALRPSSESKGGVALPILEKMMGQVNIDQWYGQEEEGGLQARNLYAILVGINQYDAKGKLPPLSASLNDVERMQHYLESAFSRKPYQLHVYRLLDQEANHQNVTNHLTLALDNASERDAVLFYFSGYSRPLKQDSTDDNGWGLVFYDTDPAAPYNLEAAVEGESRDNIFLICDASDSAALLLKKPLSHVVLFAACGPEEQSKQIYDDKQARIFSAFTYHLIEALNQSGEDLSNAGLIAETQRSVSQQGIAQSPHLITTPENEKRAFLEFDAVEKQPTTQALIIGMGQAPGGLGKIDGCIADTEVVEQLLKRHSQQNNRRVSIQKLLDEQATTRAVRQALDGLKSLNEGDSFFFYFAGSSTSGSADDFKIDFKGSNLVLFDAETKEGALLTQLELENSIYAAIAEKDIHCSIFLNPPPLSDADKTMNTSPLRTGKSQLKGSLVILHGSSPREGIGLDIFDGEKGLQSFFSNSLQSTIEAQGHQLTYKDLLEGITEKLKTHIRKQRPYLEAFPGSAEGLHIFTGIVPKEDNLPVGSVHALVVGVETYHPASRVSALDGCITDIDAIEKSLNSISGKTVPGLHLTRLANEEATRKRVLEALERIFAAAKEEDHIFLFFEGHTDQTEDERNSIVLYDSRTDEGQDLFASDLEAIMQKASGNPYVFMILDSGKNWLDSSNPRHVFIAGHPDNKDLPASDGGSFGTYVASLLEKAEAYSYRSFFRSFLEHYQNQPRFKRRSQLFAHPSSTSRLLFQAGAASDKKTSRQPKESENKPIFLLAFSNPEGADIPEVEAEMEALKELFEAKLHHLEAELIIAHNPDSKRLEALFCGPDTRHRIHLFHFAGLGLTTETSKFGFYLEDGLLDYFSFLPWLDFQENIHLVFLNVCRSNFMAEWMAQLGVVTAIGAEGEIADTVFKAAALKFYREWLKGEKNTRTTYLETINPDNFNTFFSSSQESGPHRAINVEEETFSSQFHFYSFPWAEQLVEATHFDYGEPNLYAVLVGINQYPNLPSNKQLNSSVNDVELVRKLLTEDYIQKKFNNIHLLDPLLDTDATKDNIVNAFRSHLGQAKPGDFALFYFSGHGIREKTSIEAFSHSGHIGGIICTDFRDKGKKDPDDTVLSNLELRYLIQELAKDEQGNAKANIITIFDSSHAGTSTGSSVQTLPERNWEGFLFHDSPGLLEMVNSGKPLGEILPQEQHINMTAAMDIELAWYSDKGSSTGAFTEELIEVVKQHQGDITYHDLHIRVLNRMRFYYQRGSFHDQRQTPQLYINTHQPNDRYQIFLSKRMHDPSSDFTLEYNRAEQEWRTSQGALHGVPPESKEQNVNAVVFPYKDRKKQKETKILKVYPMHSVVEFPAGLDKNEAPFWSEVEGLAIPKIQVFLSGDKEGVKLAKEELRKLMKAAKQQRFELIDDEANANYVLQAKGGAFRYHLPFEPSRPLIRETPYLNANGQPAASRVAKVFNHFNRIAEWNFLKNLNHFLATVPSHLKGETTMYPIELRLFEYIGNGTERRVMPADNKFLFELSEEKRYIWIRFELENFSPEQLHTSLAYMPYNFGFLTNRKVCFLGAPQVIIRENTKAYSRKLGAQQPPDNNNGKGYLRLTVDQYTLDYNLQVEQAFIKLISSKTPFQIHTLHMDPLPLPGEETVKTRGFEAEEKENVEFPEFDWEVRTFELIISNPDYDPER